MNDYWERSAVSDGEEFHHKDHFFCIHHEYNFFNEGSETSRFFVTFNGESHQFDSFASAEEAIISFESNWQLVRDNNGRVVNLRAA